MKKVLPAFDGWDIVCFIVNCIQLYINYKVNSYTSCYTKAHKSHTNNLELFKKSKV